MPNSNVIIPTLIRIVSLPAASILFSFCLVTLQIIEPSFSFQQKMGNSSSSSGNKYKRIGGKGNKSSSSSCKKKYHTADFALHGPKHLPPNWCQNEEHQYAVAACFTNGVYVLEEQRKQRRADSKAEAWWESFGYTLLQTLAFPDEGSIFGAIYVRNPRVAAPESAPRMVLAYRGMVEDWDQATDPNTPPSSHIFSSMLKVAMESTSSMGYYSKHGNVWVCGHSLGAAMGLITGKCLARSGTYLDSFFFNPPIVLDYLRKGVLDFYTESLSPWSDPVGLVAWNMFVLAQEEYTSKDGRKAFERLVGWQPRLLVNPGDFISNGYIEYYRDRETTTEVCRSELSLPFVTPSARLVLNVGSTEECHGIKQWWDSNLNVEHWLHVCDSGEADD